MSGQRVFRSAVVSFLALVALGAAAAPTKGSSKPACGAPGKPACPLQHWMRTRIAAPMATHDYAALAKAFDELAKLDPQPDKWRNWVRYARRGAEKARDGKAPVLECVNCHKVYRAEYNVRFRERPID